MVASQQTFFFKTYPPKTTQKEKVIRWSSIIQSLITHGHDLASIQNYTQRQIELFYEAICSEKNHNKADFIEAVNHGFSGGQVTSDYVKKLRER